MPNMNRRSTVALLALLALCFILSFTNVLGT